MLSMLSGNDSNCTFTFFIICVFVMTVLPNYIIYLQLQALQFSYLH